jgi:hypothetical protein
MAGAGKPGTGRPFGSGTVVGESMLDCGLAAPPQ